MGKERQFESFIQKIGDEERLIEIIFDGQFKFAFLVGEDVPLEDKDHGLGGELPEIEKDSEIRTGGILLASGATPYHDFSSLRREIQGHLRKYIKMDPKYYLIVAVFIMASWRYDSFSSMPFLRALGVPGTGKSRFIDVVGDLLYRRLKTSGATSFSAMFRLCS
ncbi:MAG: hypothetical protein GTO24_26805, partial [candidate division Zixibacteria bacterium]|nr:hypothetical protein [candidate division Zixibacteria bacterium]